MRMRVIAILGSIVSAADDVASLLQSKRVSSHAGVQYATVVKNVEHANATSTKWSCATMPCEMHVCQSCPVVACDCWRWPRVECPTCCKSGDVQCLEDKMKLMMTRKLKGMSDAMKYSRNYAKWERTSSVNKRKAEDAENAWKRANLKHVRKHEDTQWQSGTKKHKALVKEFNSLQKHMNKWSRNLSDEVATVQSLMDGAIQPPPSPQLPTGFCPPAPLCPLPGRCPKCPKPSCPPCWPAPPVNCEMACPEDHHIASAIAAALKKEPFVACPTMDKYCSEKDSWPSVCPTPRIMCREMMITG